MKLIILSDAHLFQRFMNNYDPLLDFKKIFQKIKEVAPDAVLMAGDMFDFKKTPTIYLRHYEGEGLMIKVRSIIKEAGIPVYAIRGNHEKEEVLRGLDQTLDNFHYVKNDWVRLSEVSIYFMDTHIEGELYEPNIISQILQQITSAARNVKGMKILVSHEIFAPFDNCLPKEVMQKAGNIFNWIVNGHMHLWNSSTYGFKNIITLPSLLPSRVILGKYWIERYIWERSENLKVEKRDSPYGFVVLDTEKRKIEFCPFIPSKTIVEISIDVTNLSLKDAINRFREILEEIRERKDKNSLIILPEIHGYASFITSFVNEIFKEYAELNIESLRTNTIPKIITPSGKIISLPILDPEQVFEEIEKELPEIANKLIEELQIELNINVLKKILAGMRESELLEKLPPRTTRRLENLLSEVLLRLPNIKKPETFEDDMKNIIKRVREK